MKVGINITREHLGGITAVNLNLLNQLHGSTHGGFVGIELNPMRVFKAPSLFRHLDPEWFSHHVVSICDYGLGVMLKRSRSLKELELQFSPIIGIVRDIIRKEKIDVMLLNGTYYIPWIIALACKKEKIPVVLWYAGVLSQETAYFKPKDREVMKKLEKAMINLSERIIFPSELCRNIVKKSVLNTKKTREGSILPNPINPVFTEATPVNLSVENRIAFVGRFHEIKGPEKFVELHKLLLKEGWLHEATMVTNLPKSHKRKIPKTIQVLPSMTPSELLTFYSSQGIVISPSRFETFGNVPIEAVCTGIPVLVHKNMGCADVLKESNLSDFITDFDDTKEAIKQIKKICGQAILPKQVNNVRKHVDAKYLAQEVVAILKETSGK